MPAPTTQTSALVFLSDVDDRMIEAVATQTEGVLRRLDSRFRAVLLLEERLEVFFVMIGNRLRERAPIKGPIQKTSETWLLTRIWRPGQLPKSVKLQRPARATVCSHSLRDATASVHVILNKYPPRKVIKSARRGRWSFISTAGRSVLCSSSLLNRRDGGNRKRDGGHGCDGTSISQYHAHLQPLKRDADSGSDRASESAVVRSGTVGGHKSGHSHINEPCQEMA